MIRKTEKVLKRFRGEKGGIEKYRSTSEFVEVVVRRTWWLIGIPVLVTEEIVDYVK